MFLLSDILANRRFVQPYCADIIPNAPESPIAELVLQMSIPIEYHKGTLTLQVAHKR